MLKIVGNPVAVIGTLDLFTAAKKMGWECIENISVCEWAYQAS